MENFIVVCLGVLICAGAGIFTASVTSQLRDIARRKRRRYFVEILNGDGGYVEVGERGMKAIPPEMITKIWFFNGESLTKLNVEHPYV